MNYDVTRKVQAALADIMREAFPDSSIYTDEPMSTERDTHFAKFAELLLEDLGGDIAQLMDETADSGDYEGHMRLIIAQRSYDLAQHTIDALWPYINDKAVEPSATDIPDLTQWPESPTAE